VTRHRDNFATYALHYERMGNRRPSEQVLPDEVRGEYWKPWMDNIPKDARIIDIGCGAGHQLFALKLLGFSNLTGIEFTEILSATAVEELGSAATITLIDAFDFLPEHRAEFDVAFVNDVLEHIPADMTIDFLRLVKDALTPGGVISIRVPNMSTLLAQYIRYMDFTHVIGFTEFSLMQALDLAGFQNHRLVSSRPEFVFSIFRPWRTIRRMLAIIVYQTNRAVHHALYLLRMQYPKPTEFAYNIDMISVAQPNHQNL